MAAATLLTLLACAGGLPRIASILASPHDRRPVTISRLIARGDYLEVNMGPVGSAYRVYLPNTDLCRSFIGAASAIGYSTTGSFGSLWRQQLSCPLAGSASLQQWREATKVSRETVLKRETARYEIVYGDDEVLMARGYFPLAAHLGILPNDIIVVTPASDACRSILTRGEAFMAYRSRGFPVIVLTLSGVRCNVTGLIVPTRR